MPTVHKTVSDYFAKIGSCGGKAGRGAAKARPLSKAEARRRGLLSGLARRKRAKENKGVTRLHKTEKI